MQGRSAVHAKNFGNVRFVRDESVHIVNTKNCVQCKSKVHTTERIVGLRTIMCELWEVLWVLWEVCIIEGVRIVGGAIGMCARLWKKYTQRVVGAVRTIARIVGGAMGCGVSRRKSIRG